MTEPNVQVSTISVDDLLHSFDRLIEREREKAKRTILAEVELKIQSSFDDFRCNLLDGLCNSIAFEECDPMSAANHSDRSASTIEKKNFELIKIEDSDEEDIVNDHVASATSTATATPSSSSPYSPAPALPIAPTDYPLLPDEYLKKYPVLIKKFDTCQEADEYRLSDNFRFPRRVNRKDGLVQSFICYQYFACSAKIAIWKSKANKQYLMFSNGEPHSHDRAASKSIIDPETRREIERLFKRGAQTPAKLYELLCAKHGEKAVNGFDIMRCFEILRKHKYKKSRK